MLRPRHTFALCFTLLYPEQSFVSSSCKSFTTIRGFEVFVKLVLLLFTYFLCSFLVSILESGELDSCNFRATCPSSTRLFSPCLLPNLTLFLPFRVTGRWWPFTQSWCDVRCDCSSTVEQLLSPSLLLFIFPLFDLRWLLAMETGPCGPQNTRPANPPVYPQARPLGRRMRCVCL